MILRRKSMGRLLLRDPESCNSKVIPYYTMLHSHHKIKLQDTARALCIPLTAAGLPQGHPV